MSHLRAAYEEHLKDTQGKHGCRSVSYTHLVVQHFAELPQHALPDSQHTLVCPELLHIALVGNRTALVDIHDIHGAVADVAEHIRSCKVPKICCNGGKALREDVRACKLHMVVHASESEVRRFLLQKIRPESVLLFADPCEGQTCGKMDAGRGKMANVQLPSDGGKGCLLYTSRCV